MSIFSKLLGNAGEANYEDLNKKYHKLLVGGEEIQMGFKLIRDTFLFTTKRLVIIEVQGITGSKVEYISIPYKSIARYSVETAGTLELDAELKIWISSEPMPSIIKKLNRAVDVFEVQKILTHYVIH